MHNKAKKVAVVGILSSMAAVLMYIWHIPVMPSPFTQMFRLDFAEIPALIASTLISPICGVIVALIRNLLHLFRTETLCIGELSNFILGSTYAYFTGYLIRLQKKKHSMVKISKLIGTMCLMTLVQIIIASVSNYFLILPMYAKYMNFDVNSIGGMKFVITAGVIPFNAIKIALNSMMFIIIYKALIPKIRRYI